MHRRTPGDFVGPDCGAKAFKVGSGNSMQVRLVADRHARGARRWFAMKMRPRPERAFEPAGKVHFTAKDGVVLVLAAEPINPTVPCRY